MGRPKKIPVGDYACNFCDFRGISLHSLNHHLSKKPDCKKLETFRNRQLAKDMAKARLRTSAFKPKQRVQQPVCDEADDMVKRDVFRDREQDQDRWVEMLDRLVYKQAETQGRGDTSFERIKLQRSKDGHEGFHPFTDQNEWELTEFLLNSGLSNEKKDELLKMKAIQDGVLSKNQSWYQLSKKIDRLPAVPELKRRTFTLTGDLIDPKTKQPRVERADFWHKDILECVRELFGDPNFKDVMEYEPRRIFVDKEGKEREYSEMWTGDWWWETQQKLPQGATIAPLIVSSDETHLTQYSGDKKAWPVYLSLGNIAKDVRRKPTHRASVLIAYLPTNSLSCFSDKRRPLELQKLFHRCMTELFKPLVDAGRNGVKMMSSDGYIRNVYPILAAFVGDFPEQCRVACCKRSFCPQCERDSGGCGDQVDQEAIVYRDPDKVRRVLKKGRTSAEFVELGLVEVSPFWAELPHCDIFRAITPDILHQLHRGVFDHVKEWATEAVLNSDLDARYQAMPPHPDVKHFAKGVSATTKWTGKEAKGMEKVFVGALSKGVKDNRVVLAARALIDFINYAQFQVHQTKSLAKLQESLDRFHAYKDVFVDLDIREEFNKISKMHNICHYMDSIRWLGTPDGYNTEASERLHINLAKEPYAATNRRDFLKQMKKWLRRREAVYKFARFLQWDLCGYTCPIPSAVSGLGGDGDDEGDDATIPVHGLAKKPPSLKTASEIEKDHGVVGFVDGLVWYLDGLVNVDPETFKGRPSLLFGVYTGARVQLPLVPEASPERIIDKVYASPGRAPTSSRFSTILFRRPKEHRGPQQQGHYPDVCVGQVRTIFTLPPGVLDTDMGPLAFVRMFTPLKRWQDDERMFLVSPAKYMGGPSFWVVPVTDILQSCHLIPQFGSRSAKLELGWRSETVLEETGVQYYLNSDVRVYDFYRLRYRVECP